MATRLRDTTSRELVAAYESDSMRWIVDAVPSGILIANEQGIIVFVNKEIERIFHFQQGELVGKPIEILVPDRFKRSHVPLRQGFFHLPNARPMGTGRELSGRRADGSEFPIEIGLNTIQTDNGFMVLGSIIDITERRLAQDELRAALREKEMLLTEVHHRVKNNLSVICSLLSMQLNHQLSGEGRVALEESRQRVMSIALVHEHLYSSNRLNRVNFAEYASQLAHEVFAANATAGTKIHLELDTEPIEIDIQRAVPCGLILNELVTNAFKYAFPDGREGTVKIEFHRQGGEVLFAVSDNGVGMPESIEWGESQDSTGLQIVHILSRQLGGRARLLRDRGTRFELTLSPATARGAGASG